MTGKETEAIEREPDTGSAAAATCATIKALSYLFRGYDDYVTVLIANLVCDWP
jgi:hypothetical protein